MSLLIHDFWLNYLCVCGQGSLNEWLWLLKFVAVFKWVYNTGSHISANVENTVHKLCSLFDVNTSYHRPCGATRGKVFVANMRQKTSYLLDYYWISHLCSIQQSPGPSQASDQDIRWTSDCYEESSEAQTIGHSWEVQVSLMETGREQEHVGIYGYKQVSRQVQFHDHLWGIG